jgi:hypothetical protein
MVGQRSNPSDNAAEPSGWQCVTEHVCTLQRRLLEPSLERKSPDTCTGSRLSRSSISMKVDAIL